MKRRTDITKLVIIQFLELVAIGNDLMKRSIIFNNSVSYIFCLLKRILLSIARMTKCVAINKADFSTVFMNVEKKTCLNNDAREKYIASKSQNVRRNLLQRLIHCLKSEESFDFFCKLIYPCFRQFSRGVWFQVASPILWFYVNDQMYLANCSLQSYPINETLQFSLIFILRVSRKHPKMANDPCYKDVISCN